MCWRLGVEFELVTLPLPVYFTFIVDCPVGDFPTFKRTDKEWRSDAIMDVLGCLSDSSLADKFTIRRVDRLSCPAILRRVINLITSTQRYLGIRGICD